MEVVRITYALQLHPLSYTIHNPRFYYVILYYPTLYTPYSPSLKHTYY